MALTLNDGPLWSVGGMRTLAASFGAAVPDYNPDAGPCIEYQGGAVFDPRFVLQASKGGFGGVQPAYLLSWGAEVVDAVPAAYGTAKIAALAHATSGTAMTLVSTNAAGISINVPISPFSGAVVGSTVVTAPIMLDFGFAFGNTTAGSATITVADSTQFTIGMPLVIPGAVSGGSLLTFVTALPSATTITVYSGAVPSVTASNVAIGTGDRWPGAPLSTAAQALPTSHYPYLAGGPGLFLDPSQSLARGVSITTGTAGTGGSVKVSGWDMYWQPMNETIVASASASTTVYGKKAFKAIKSVTPQFTDGTGTYSVGTSDVFGFALRARNWERTSGAWAASFLTGNTGFTAYTAPASGDVRGTFQVSAIGGATGYGSTASNGAISSLVMAGNRLVLYQNLSTADTLMASQSAPQTMFGATQT